MSGNDAVVKKKVKLYFMVLWLDELGDSTTQLNMPGLCHQP